MFECLHLTRRSSATRAMRTHRIVGVQPPVPAQRTVRAPHPRRSLTTNPGP